MHGNFATELVGNGNRTEKSNLLIKGMITDGRRGHEVLLAVNPN